MDLDRSGLSTDEYYMTALQIFDYCGTESTGTLRVDALMDKFAPFVKTNKAEYSFLKSLLDPEEENAAIDVSLLAKTLQKYSENQKSKADLDESFNLKSGAPQDSDSGISSDGFQLLEELQCELREKAHLAQQLRSQLDFTDRQHEEALGALTDERDSLRGHLNILREENMSLSHLRRDYEEACERLAASERALDDARRELDAARRRNKLAAEQVAALDNEKLTLQELLTKSKAECHRINEMYASRQSALLEQNEALRTEHADLASRLQDQDEFVQQMIKEKSALLEQNEALRTEHADLASRLQDQDEFVQQMIKEKSALLEQNEALRTEHADLASRLQDQDEFVQQMIKEKSALLEQNEALRTEHADLASRLQDQDEFVHQMIKEKSALLEQNEALRTEHADLASRLQDQDEFVQQMIKEKSALLEQNEALRTEHADLASRLQDQDEFVQQMIKEKVLLEMELKDVLNKSNQTQLRMDRSIDISYTDDQVLSALDSLNADTRFCSENRILDEESFINNLREQDQGRGTNVSLFDEIRFSLSRVNITDSNSLLFDKVLDTSFITVGTQTADFKPYDEENKDPIQNISTLGTQTEEIESINNNNCNSKCLECEKLSRYTVKLERDVNMSHRTVTDMQVEIEQYESNLHILEKFVEEGDERNSVLQSIIQSLESKIGLLEVACTKQTERLNSLTPDNDASSQTKWDQANASTQVDVACPDCEKRNAVVPHRSLRKFFWDALKCLFQVFAVLCFVCALCALYGVSSRAAVCPRAPAQPVPWRWLQAADLMDLLLRIDYVADVPM
ncbi:unnamed protein product [Chrysodeixis includens]|uniref:Uncharacterized protein n=1 Tax=Chrysodeixis includens TaxID=689277 RepID=A0A9N8KXJ3_CHRIL|nr:unnamed protein product [Chrysodeixis includens]